VSGGYRLARGEGVDVWLRSTCWKSTGSPRLPLLQYCRAQGRVKIEEAHAEMNVIAGRWERNIPTIKIGASTQALQDDLAGDARPTLLILAVRWVSCC